MSFRAVAVLVSALVLLAVPGTAAAQGPPSEPACSPPTLEGFLPSQPPRSERPERLRVVAPGAATVTVAWPDQTT